MQLKSLTCLPRVAVIPNLINVSDSRIIHIPFSEWLTLEGQSRNPQYDKLNGKYDRNPPVFWEKIIDVDSSLVMNHNRKNVNTLFEYINQDMEALVNAIHWYTGTAPIHPLRSVIYFDPRSPETFELFPELKNIIFEGGVQRLYGESEKDYATQNENPNISLRQIDEKPLANMMAFVKQTQNLWMNEQYELALQSLSMSSLPGLNWPSRILLIVGAYESLFLPDGKDIKLLKCFKKRLACMASKQFAEVEQYENWLKLAYQLRNTLVHGKSYTKFLKKIPFQSWEFVNSLSRIGIIALCNLIQYRYGHPNNDGMTDPLWGVLDSINNAEGFSAFRTMIPNVSTVPLSYQWQMEV